MDFHIRSKYQIYLVLAGLIFFPLLISCVHDQHVKKPDDLIEEDLYIDLMIEMQHIITYKNAEPDSVNADSLKNMVYQKYGITDQQYRNSHEYYQQQFNAQTKRIDEALLRLEDQESLIQAHLDSLRKGTDGELERDSLLKPAPELQNINLQ